MKTYSGVGLLAMVGVTALTFHHAPLALPYSANVLGSAAMHERPGYNPESVSPTLRREDSPMTKQFPAQQPGRYYLTEGGQETELMYKYGFDLHEFAMFPMLDVPKAIGLARAAATAGLPVSVSFTLDSNHRLHSGPTLREAIEAIDAATGDTTPAF